MRGKTTKCGTGFQPVAKRMLLMAMALACGTVSSCGFGLKDINHNIVAGTAGFVKSYTTGFWDAVIPGLDEIFNAGGE